MLTLGSQIPDLMGKNQFGDDVSLRASLGTRTAIYFYPKDDTPGCTAQACSIRDGEQALAAEGITVLGISADSVTAHQKFSVKYTLPFTLISDPDRSIIEAFGVWGPKKFMGKTYDGIHRTSFIFDERGTLVKVIEKPNTKNHAEEIINFFKENK
ncbi:MAG: thioredoxin-dependent thiol peroxidase [Flavobacteriales bacterium]